MMYTVPVDYSRKFESFFQDVTDTSDKMFMSRLTTFWGEYSGYVEGQYEVEGPISPENLYLVCYDMYYNISKNLHRPTIPVD